MILEGKYIKLTEKNYNYILNYLYIEGYYFGLFNGDIDNVETIRFLNNQNLKIHNNPAVIFSIEKRLYFTHYSDTLNIKYRKELNIQVLFREKKLKHILRNEI